MLTTEPFARLLRLALTHLYFRAIRVYGREHLPADGVVLLACNHRNGAVDGLVMDAVLDKPLGVVGRNLTASPYLRFILTGSIAIHRHPSTPSENKENLRGMQEAAGAAVSGRQLLMFPEGTSKLGPSLLPVKKGMAYLARLAVKEAGGKPVRIVPVGLHYARGFAFRSDVEVAFGPALNASPEETGDLDALTERIANAMAGVAVTFHSADEQHNGELFADTACFLDPATSHRSACLACGSGAVAEGLRQRFANAVAGRDRHCLPPVLPPNGLTLELIRLFLAAPVMLAALLANLLPCLGAHFVARKQADDDNVITLWRLLAGVPLWVIQFFLSLFTVAVARPRSLAPLLAGYGLVSWAGIWLYPRWRLALAAVVNHFSSQRRQYMIANKVVREWLQQQR